MAHTPNSAADFLHHVNRSGGTDACWPWLLKQNAKGRARFRFQGKMRDVHQIAYFIEYGEWLRRYDLSACPRLRSCCNPSHIEKRHNINHQDLAQDFTRMAKELDRQSTFSKYLSRKYPDLHWLIQLLGDNAGKFLSEHEGKTIQLQMTIPPRSQLIEEARAIDCFSALDQAEPCDLMKARKQLQARYELDPDGLAACAKLGKALLEAADIANE